MMGSSGVVVKLFVLDLLPPNPCCEFLALASEFLSTSFSDLSAVPWLAIPSDLYRIISRGVIGRFYQLFSASGDEHALP